MDYSYEGNDVSIESWMAKSDYGKLLKHAAQIGNGLCIDWWQYYYSIS